MRNSIEVFENLQNKMNMKMGYKNGPCFNNNLLQYNDEDLDPKYTRLFPMSRTDDFSARKDAKKAIHTEKGRSYGVEKKKWIDTAEGQRFANKQIDDANSAVIAAFSRVKVPSQALLDMLGIDIDRFYELQKRFD